jgi:calcineurin-like phosphoesterase family protein
MFLTADPHLYHHRLAVKRGYQSIDDMHCDIVTKWNGKISKRDTVYMLGDVTMLNKPDMIEPVLKKLNFKELILIRGNHDRKKIIELGVFSGVYDYKEINYGGNLIVLSHYPFATWNKSHRGSLNIHGHSHGKYRMSSQQMDAGMDTNDMYPYHITECIAKMKSLATAPTI